MVSVGGNLYSVPDATRKRIVEVHTLAKVQIFGDGTLIAIHPVLDGAGSGGLRWAIPRCALPVVNGARNLLRRGAAKFPAWLGGVAVYPAPPFFGGRPPALQRRRNGVRGGLRFVADCLGQEIGVFALPRARALDLDGDGVVQEAIEERASDEDLSQSEKPRFEVRIIAFFIAGVDELEEQVVAAGSDREVADFVDDEQRKSAVIARAERRHVRPLASESTISTRESSGRVATALKAAARLPLRPQPIDFGVRTVARHLDLVHIEGIMLLGIRSNDRMIE
jgi:hypothetical protein